MIAEAQDQNRFATYPGRLLLGRTASFCVERSGYNEGAANDQGITFFLPNMTWMQVQLACRIRMSLDTNLFVDAVAVFMYMHVCMYVFACMCMHVCMCV